MEKIKSVANEVAKKIGRIDWCPYQEEVFGSYKLPCKKVHLPEYAKLLDKNDFKDGDMTIISHYQPCESEHAIIELSYDKEKDKIDVIVYHFEEEVFWMVCDTMFEF